MIYLACTWPKTGPAVVLMYDMYAFALCTLIHRMVSNVVACILVLFSPALRGSFLLVSCRSAPRFSPG